MNSAQSPDLPRWDWRIFDGEGGQQRLLALWDCAQPERAKGKRIMHQQVMVDGLWAILRRSAKDAAA
jgi:hypothetical protein